MDRIEAMLPDASATKGTGTERLYLVPLAASIVLLAAIGVPLLSGDVVARDDLAIFHLPVRYLYAQALARGESVLWFPQLLNGFYIHGEGQAGVLHPLHLLLYRVLPLPAAFNLEIVASYVALLGGTYVFLLRQSLPRAAAAFGALVFAFSGFNFMHIVHPNMVAVLAHMPWLLLAIDVVVREEQPRRIAAGQLAIGLLTTSQMLLGHPQAVWLSSFMEVLYLAFLFPQWKTFNRLWQVGLGKVLGIGGGAVQLLPTWEMVSDSVRATLPHDFSFRHALDPANFLQLVSPFIARTRTFSTPYPQEAVVYCGAVASMVPLWLLIRGRRSAFHALANGALGLGVLAAILALGERGYLYRIQSHLPLIRQFEASSRYVVLLHFALAVGAAVTFRDFCAIAERRAPIAWRHLTPLALAPAASLLTLAGAIWLGSHPTAAPQLARQLAPVTSILSGTAVLLLAAALVVAAARGSRRALPLLIVVAAIDQGYYGLSYYRGFGAGSPGEFGHSQALPPEPPTRRVQSENNLLLLSGAELSGVYAAFIPVQTLASLDAQRLRIAGVEWVQKKASWQPTEPDAASLPNWAGHVEGRWTTKDTFGGNAVWSKVVDPLPRAWLVTHAAPSEDVRRDIAAIDPRSTALVQTPIDLADGRPGTVDIVADENGLVRLTTDAPSRQLLILGETWHRGWEVRVGGAAQPVVRVFGDFIGCVVPAGRQDVEFRFRPRSFQYGAWGSVAALLLMGTMFVTGRRGGRPSAR